MEEDDEKNGEKVSNAVVGKDTEIINRHTNCFCVIAERFVHQRLDYLKPQIH